MPFRRFLKYGLLLVLPAYFLVLRNSMLNRHTHVLPNGLVITHAHPFNLPKGDKPINEHTHTQTEIFYFQYFSFDYFEINGQVFNPKTLGYRVFHFVPKPENQFTSCLALTTFLRAPPVPVL